MTLHATTNMHLTNKQIETGPDIMTKASTPAYKQCRDSFYPVCPPDVEYELNQLTHVRPIGYTLAAIVYATALFIVVWMIYYRKNPIVTNSQPGKHCTVDWKLLFASAALMFFCFL